MLGFFSERKLKMDYNKIGIDAMQEGDFEKAAEAFTKAIEENGQDPVPYINFANLLSSVNELERALAFYNRALELTIGGDRLLRCGKRICDERIVFRSEGYV